MIAGDHRRWELTHALETWHWISTVTDDIAKTEVLLDVCLRRCSEDSFERFEVTVDVTQDCVAHVVY